MVLKIPQIVFPLNRLLMIRSQVRPPAKEVSAAGWMKRQSIRPVEATPRRPVKEENRRD